ncbi:interferon regulatory factor 4-like protein [Lates japonicus]|uniref:Interferon regulatory factor 4-like protein n=1 Tax=Lates japonicus TaxID=270547 RepID=A0AAD3M9N1_LATJO|nr:interferon regulatory factor 4-like protein [Lates japonicus]
MEEGAKLHLKEWLIAQIESGKYEGLCWEDEDKSMFRIPWKHAAKKDYKQTEDAALFKAWAVYKGKYREGRDKADPTMWKTRLRCALNKSTDFQEVPERNQLDITEPYKVYRIQHDNGPAKPAESPQIKDQVIIQAKRSPKSPGFLDKQLHFQNESFQANKEEEKPFTEDLMREHMYCELTEKKLKIGSLLLLPSSTLHSLFQIFVCRAVSLWEMSVSTEPCSAQQLSFPSPGSISLPSSMAEAMARLLCHLERGVLLWVAPDGVFIKRFCQGRVYWSGPMAQHTDRPNKLEREKTFKLLDIQTFVRDLQSCLQGKGPTPSYEIELCFGEEYPDPNVPKTKKLIMAQVVPLFAVELLQRLTLGETEEKQLALGTNTEEEKM